MIYFLILRHQGEDGWCPNSPLFTSRRRLGRWLYRGESNALRRHTMPCEARAQFSDPPRTDPTPAQLKCHHHLRVIAVGEDYKHELDQEERELAAMYAKEVAS